MHNPYEQNRDTPNPYAREPDPQRDGNEPSRLKQSRLGLWSFGLSIFNGVAMILLVVFAAFLVMESPNIANDASSPALVVVLSLIHI